MRSEFQKQIDNLSTAGPASEAAPTDQAEVAAALTASRVSKIELVAAKPPALAGSSLVAAHDPEEIPPEAEAAIKATLTAFLGQKVQIRSVKLLADPNAAATWVTQGRAAVHASHNQRAGRA
jgi:hypothetical protein